MEINQFRDVDLVIDKANDNFIQKQFVSQGDLKGRTLTVQITDRGVIGEVPGLTLNLRWTNTASGLTDLSAFECIDQENSLFRIEYPANMLTPGKVLANIQVAQNGKVTHLKTFELTVQKLAGEMVGVTGQAEYGALVAVLADANKYRTDINDLFEKKADKKELAEANEEIVGLASKKVDKGGASQVTWSMLAQDAREQISGDKVAVVEKDGVTTENYVNGSVTRIKTDYYTSVNDIYFNASGTFSGGGYYNATTGAFVADVNWGWVSIANFDLTTYRLLNLLQTTNRHVTYWDSEGIFISGESVNQFTPPESTYEIRISIRVIEKNQVAVIPAEDKKVIFKDNELLVDNNNIADDVAFEEKNMTFLKFGPSKINRFHMQEAKNNGYYQYSDGVWTTNVIYFTSNKIYVNPGDIIKSNTKGSTTLHTNFWDSDGNWISGLRKSTDITVPANERIVSCTLTFNKDDGDEMDRVIVTVNQNLPDEYIPGYRYSFSKSIEIPEQEPVYPSNFLANPLKNKTIIATGDSIVSAEDRYEESITGYIKIASDYFGAQLKNYAISGSTVAVKEETPTERTPISTRFGDMSDAGDVIYLQAGTNDWQYAWTPIGTMDDRSVNTFYGALHVLLSGLMTKYPAKPIFYGLPIKRRTTFNDTNDLGKTLWEYCEIIKEVCDYYSIPVLDLYHDSMLNPHIDTQKTAFLPDGTHPNAIGHQILARSIVDKLKGLFLF